MTYRERRRRDLLWTIHRWLTAQRYFIWVLALGALFSFSPAFAAEPAKITSEDLLKMLNSKKAPAVVKPVAAAAPAPAVSKPYLKKVDPELMKMKGTESTIRGEVRTKIKMGMGVVYDVDKKARSSQEIWVDFTDVLKVKGVLSAQDFESGDKVEVVMKTVKVGDLKKRIVTSVSLIKRMTQAEKDALAKKEAEDEKKAQMKAEAMTSEET